MVDRRVFVFRESVLQQRTEKAARNYEFAFMPLEQIWSHGPICPCLKLFGEKRCSMLNQIIRLAIKSQLLELHG